MFHAQAQEVIKLAEPKLNQVFKDNPIEIDGDGITHNVNNMG